MDKQTKGKDRLQMKRDLKNETTKKIFTLHYQQM